MGYFDSADEGIEHQEEDVELSHKQWKLTEMLSKYSELRDAHAELKALEKRLGALVKRFSENLLPERFEEEDTTSITHGGYRFTVSQRQRCSLVNDLETAQLDGHSGKLAGMEWLKQHGGAAIVTETVNANTLSSWAKGEMEDGRELPDDLFKTYMFETTSMTKAPVK